MTESFRETNPYQCMFCTYTKLRSISILTVVTVTSVSTLVYHPWSPIGILSRTRVFYSGLLLLVGFVYLGLSSCTRRAIQSL